jgi:hypothetical protein
MKLAEHLADPLWRYQNLYSIKKEGTGEAIPFRMRDEQKWVANHLLTKPKVPLYIIKARRLGLSTGLGVMMGDDAVWRSGSIGKLIERSQEMAAEKMRNIIRFSVESMPPEILARLKFPRRSDSALEILIDGLDENCMSGIHAGMSARGGDCSFLWVSELGPIAYNDPKRAQEIRSGAFPAARLGKRVVETTWMGGKGGELWEMIKPILEKDPDADGEIVFFPWHGDPACVRIDAGALSKDTEDYFLDLSNKLGKTFDQSQKRWYAVESKRQGIFMKREYPSTLEEAWSAPVKGAIYAPLLARLRAEGNVCNMPWNRSSLVHTFWDLGAPLNMKVWYVQFVGREIHVIDFDDGLDLTTTERVAHMNSKGYPLGKHYLPHDGAAQQKGKFTFKQELEQAGLHNIETIPRSPEIWRGINKVQELMPLMVFRLPATQAGIEALEFYHTKDDDVGNPVHDWSSHAADALRTLGEATAYGMVKPGMGNANTMNADRKPVVVRTGFRPPVRRR